MVALIGTGAVVSSSAKPAPAAAQGSPTSTVKVEMGNLSATVSVEGTLTYQAQSDGSPYSVINQSQGTYTKLPGLGQVISQGQVLYRVNDSPVVLLYGSTPAYRTLWAGATGADVAELNADLVALGYATASQISPTSSAFGWPTAVAVEKLQAALGVSQTGELNLGDAVFEPTAIRVTNISPQLGGGARPGETVMQATSTTRIVQVALDAAQETEVAVGDTVTITLPNNKTTPGVVSSVGAIAACPPSPASRGANSSSAAPGDNCSSSGTTPTITVDVTPSDQAASSTWDEAPVRVGITTASVPHALAVPVTALMAESEGGYAVEVVGTTGSNHLVPVSLGLFDDAAGLVQVTGSGLVAGEQVVVPAT